MTKQLKPCPFCGGEAVYMDKKTSPDRPQPTIECMDCGCSMSEISKEFLIESWGKRADDETKLNLIATINKITEKTQAELQQALDSRRNHIRESGFRGSFVLYYNGKIRALRNISNFISETTKAGEQSCP